jgi:hypothetical protein
MNVFSYLDPFASGIGLELISLWSDSWRAQGWTPRLLTIRDARKHPDFDENQPPPLFAWEQAGGGWYCPTHVINFSFSPKRLRAKHEFFYGGVLWATRRGANEIRVNPALGRHPGINLVSVFPLDPVLPLVSFERCNSVEEIQRGIAICSQARKKN